MKKLIIATSFIAIISVCFLTSCEHKQEITDNNLEFDTLKVSEAYYLDNDSTQPSCNLKINFVYPISYTHNDKLSEITEFFIGTVLGKKYAELSPKEAVDKYVEEYIANYKEDAKVFFKEKEADIQNEGDNYFSYYENIANEVRYNRAGLVSLQVVQTNYKGGNNSYQQTRNYVLNLKTGQLVTEEDIFASGYEKVLSTIFQTYLKEANKVKEIHDLEDLGYFGIEEIVPNDNFLIDDEGITYVFNKGEYSVFQLDEIKIFVPYKDILYTLKEDSPISILVQN